MSKLKLEIEALVVETFATGADARQTGTVHAHGHAPSHPNQMTCGQTCDGGPACMVTGDGTCIEPCGSTLCGEETSVTCPFDSVDVC